MLTFFYLKFVPPVCIIRPWILPRSYSRMVRLLAASRMMHQFILRYMPAATCECWKETLYGGTQFRCMYHCIITIDNANVLLGFMALCASSLNTMFQGPQWEVQDCNAMACMRKAPCQMQTIYMRGHTYVSKARNACMKHYSTMSGQYVCLQAAHLHSESCIMPSVFSKT